MNMILYQAALEGLFLFPPELIDSARKYGDAIESDPYGILFGTSVLAACGLYKLTRPVFSRAFRKISDVHENTGVGVDF